MDSQDAHQTLLSHTLSALAKIFPLSVPSLCVFGEVLSRDEHTGTFYMWNQSQLCSDSVNDFTCLSFFSCNE